MTKQLLRLPLTRKSEIRLEFKLADLWVGAFWASENLGMNSRFNLWVCLLPCLPIHFIYWYKSKEQVYYN